MTLQRELDSAAIATVVARESCRGKRYLPSKPRSSRLVTVGRSLSLAHEYEGLHQYQHNGGHHQNGASQTTQQDFAAQVLLPTFYPMPQTTDQYDGP